MLSESLLPTTTSTKSAPTHKHPGCCSSALQPVSTFLFLYILPVLWHGYKTGGLKADDLPNLSARDAAEQCCGSTHINTSSGVRRGLLSRLHQLLAAYPGEFVYSGVLLGLATAASLSLPLVLHKLLESLGDPAISAQFKYGLAAAVFACSLTQAVTMHRFWYDAALIGLRGQIIASTEVLHKLLRLNTQGRSMISDGRLVNLFAIDAARMNDVYLFPFLHWNTWGAVVPIVVSVYNLYALLGVAGLLGSASAVLLIPSSALISRAVKRASERVQTCRDARGRLTGEALSGIATIKANGWQEWFIDRIQSARSDEMAAVARKQFFGVLADFLSQSATLIISLVALVSWAALHADERLSPATAFAAIA